MHVTKAEIVQSFDQAIQEQLYFNVFGKISGFLKRIENVFQEFDIKPLPRANATDTFVKGLPSCVGKYLIVGTLS